MPQEYGRCICTHTTWVMEVALLVLFAIFSFTKIYHYRFTGKRDSLMWWNLATVSTMCTLFHGTYMVKLVSLLCLVIDVHITQGLLYSLCTGLIFRLTVSFVSKLLLVCAFFVVTYYCCTENLSSTAYMVLALCSLASSVRLFCFIRRDLRR